MGKKQASITTALPLVATGETPQDDGRFCGSNRELAAVGRDGKAVTLITGGLPLS